MTGTADGLTAHERMMLVATVGRTTAEQDEGDLAASLHQLRSGLQAVVVELERMSCRDRPEP